MAVTSVYVIVCWFLCWILFLPCQLSSGTWKSLPASEQMTCQIANEKILCRTQKCNFWKRPSTDFDENYIFGIGTSSTIEWYLSFLLSISWPSVEPWWVRVESARKIWVEHNPDWWSIVVLTRPITQQSTCHAISWMHFKFIGTYLHSCINFSNKVAYWFIYFNMHCPFSCCSCQKLHNNWWVSFMW